MRKYFFMIFATFFAGNLWAACQPTTYELKNRSEPGHDEYLYTDTSQREIRQDDGTGEAYLCGYLERGGCEVGEKFAFEGAAVGHINHTDLTVYTCSGGGDNYYWTAKEVEEKCYSDESVKSEYIGGITLYKVDDDYCKKVVSLKEVINEIVDNAIRNNNDALLITFREELNKKIGNVYKSEEFTTAVVTVVNSMGLSGDRLNTIIGLINKEIQNSGFAGQIDEIKLDIDDINNRINDLGKRVDMNEENIARVRQGLNQAVTKLHGLAAKQGIFLRKTETEFNKVWEKLNATMSATQIQTFVNEQITALEDEIMVLIQAQGGNLDNFKNEVKNIEKDLRSVLDEYGIKIVELDSRITELGKRVDVNEENIARVRQGLNQAVTKLHGLAAKQGVYIRKTETEFNKVWEKLNATMSATQIQTFVNEQITTLEDEIMAEIAERDKDLTEFKAEVAEMERVLQGQLDGFGVELLALDERITALEEAKEEILKKLDSLAATDASLKSAIDALKQDLKKKVTMDQVLKTVAEQLAKANLNENQKKQVIEIIKQYTASLSAGQRQEVEKLIEEKIGKRFEELGAANQLQDAQRVSQDKVNSAMSVLNAFAAGQDASVWRNADGKFNTARLASDATAGVILGTAGGLISNKIIKKNQIKKGFEGIGCYVGGQVVADYGDEFTVGMM